MSHYPEILSGAEITALEFPHWHSDEELELSFEDFLFNEAFDILMAELEPQPCTDCRDGLCNRCGGIPPCCEYCSWSGLCRDCNGTGVDEDDDYRPIVKKAGLTEKQEKTND